MSSPWALLRLSSPQLPIGGYSYSQGLEWAIEQGQVHDQPSAEGWLHDQLLLNLARFEAPLLFAHCQAAKAGDWAQLRSLGERQRASRESYELHQESRQMGYSLRQLLNGLPELDCDAREFLANIGEPHVALGWALAARVWNIPAADALAAWLWSWVENQLAVLMKALPLGQQAAQRLTSALTPILQAAQQHAMHLDAEAWGGAAFGLALASMAHERQYSRLFRS